MEKSLIRSINNPSHDSELNNSDNYNVKYMKINFNADEENAKETL